MPDYERGLVIQNPNSSHFRHPHRRKHLEHALKETGLYIETIDSESPECTLGELALRGVGEGDVVFVAGGDGTFHTVTNEVVSDQGAAAGFDKVPFVPLRAGNACDTAVMLNRKRSPADIVHWGHEVDIHLLEVTIAEKVAYALGYFSIGATGEAMYDLERLKDTSTGLLSKALIRVPREAYATMMAGARMQPFELVDAAGKPQWVTDWMCMNGDRIAKLGRPHADLLRPGFESVVVDRTGLRGTVLTMSQLGLGRLAGEITTERQYTVVADEGRTLEAQMDGETRPVQSGTLISVKSSERTLRTITTRS